MKSVNMRKTKWQKLKMTTSKEDFQQKRSLVTLKTSNICLPVSMLCYRTPDIFIWLRRIMLKYIPIVLITKLGYRITVLNIGLLTHSLMSIAIIVFLVRVYITSESAYFVCIIAFLSMIVVGFLFLLMNPTNSYTVNWILAMLLYTLFAVLSSR